jgi:multidrug efflux system membrane fusion protein
MTKPLRYLALAGGLAVVAAVVVIVAQAQQQRQKGARFTPGSEGPVPVLAAAATVADVPVYLDGVGTTRALNTVTVRPQVEGRIARILFKEGQDVERGEVLAEIDPVTYQAAFDQAVARKAQTEAQLANARLDLDRYVRLAQTNSASRQQVDTQRALVAQLEAQLKLDQAAIDSARAYLGYTRIVAPISGRTGMRLVDEGNVIRSMETTGIVVITQIKPIAVVFSLPQQQLARVNRAFAQGPLTVEAFGPDNRTVIDRGTLQVVDNQVDQTTGTVKLKAEFPNAQLQLWPGQFVNVRLLIETLRQVVTVPAAAIQRGPTGTFVYVVGEDNTAAVRPVTVVQQDERTAVVAAGLAPGERVVTSGFARISDGTRVAVTDHDRPAPPAAISEQSSSRGRRGKGGPKG